MVSNNNNPAEIRYKTLKGWIPVLIPCMEEKLSSLCPPKADPDAPWNAAPGGWETSKNHMSGGGEREGCRMDRCFPRDPTPFQDIWLSRAPGSCKADGSFSSLIAPPQAVL